MIERKGWIDAAKGVTIILVVMGHLLDGFSGGDYADKIELYKIIGKSISFFHMPLFMTLSGYVFSIAYINNNNINSRLKKQVINIIGIYFLFSIFHYVFKSIVQKYTIEGINFTEFIKIPYKSIGYMWYLYVLVFLYLIMYILIKFPSRIVFPTLFIMCMAYEIIPVVIKNEFTIIKVLYCAIFFYYGVRLEQVNIKLFNKKRFLFVQVIILGLGYGIVFKGKEIPAYFNILAIFSIINLIIILIYVLSQKLQMRGLVYLGQNSLVIYLLHRYWIFIGKYAIRIMEIDNFWMALLLGTSIGVFGSLSISLLLKKIGMWDIFFKPINLYTGIKNR